MTHVILKLCTKYNKRILATILGIAVSVMYLVGTISLVGGLHAGTEKVSDMFEEGPIFVHTGDTLTESSIPLNEIENISSTYIISYIVSIEIKIGNATLPTYAISLYDPSDVFGLNQTNMTSNPDVLLGPMLQDLLSENNMEVGQESKLLLTTGGSETVVSVSGELNTMGIFPPDWIIIPRENIIELDDKFSNNCSAVILQEPDKEDLAIFDTSRYTQSHTTGVIQFFELGIYEVENALWGIISISGIIIVILAYSIMSLEIKYREKDIKILKAMGAKRSLILSIFMLKAILISLFGGLLGISIGFMVANALASFSPLFGVTSLILPVASFNSIGVPLTIAIVAGAIGSLIPSIRASNVGPTLKVVR